MCLNVGFFGLTLFINFLASCICRFMCFTGFEKFSTITFLNTFQSYSPSGTWMKWTLDLFFCTTGCWGSVHFCSRPFSLCCPDCANSTDLFSISLILSPVISILFLRTSNEGFFVVVISILLSVFFLVPKFPYFHLVLFQNFYVFAEILYLFISRELITGCWNVFIIGALQYVGKFQHLILHDIDINWLSYSGREFMHFG